MQILNVKNHDLQRIIFAAAMFAGAYLYYLHNAFITLAILFCVCLYAYFQFKDTEKTPDDTDKQDAVFLILMFSGTLMIILHFYRLSFPADPYGDEWHSIIGSHMFMKGERSFDHYFPLCGSSIELIFKGLITLFIYITGSIDYIRILPYAIYLATCLVFFLIGREINGKRFAAIMFFCFSSASFTFYSSKQLFSNYLIPLFIVLTLYAFFLFLKNKQGHYLLAAGIIYFAGFFTYAAWIVCIPYWIIALILFRKEIGNRRLFGSIVFIIVATGVSAIVYIINPPAISHAFSTPGNGSFHPDFISVFLNGISSIFILVTQPINVVHTFTPELPLLTFFEFFCFAAGAAAVMIYRRTKINIFLLSGLILTCATFFVMEPLRHHIRHVAFITFVVIVSAFGLENIAKTRFFGIFMAFYLAFSAWVFIDMQIMFDVRNPVSETGKEVADFIKSGYKNEKYIVIHEISPHGFYEAALRFKQNNYGKNWDFDKVILISNFFMKDVLYSVFNAKIAKIFYSKQPGNRFPVVVYETDSAAAGREYFIKLKEKAFQADLLLWDFEYAKAAELCRNLETGIPGAGKEKFFNTIMRFIRFEACYELKDINCIIDSGYNNMDRIYATADFYYYRGKTAYMYGNRKRALESMYIAGKMAPWWNAPKTRILQMEKEK